jgi:hypothetical protein
MDDPLTPLILDFLFHQRIGRLIDTFFTFVLLQLAFGGLYFWLFRRRGDNFSFNAEIVATQRQSTALLTEREITRLEATAAALDELETLLREDVGQLGPSLDGSKLVLPSGKTCTMTFVSIVDALAGACNTYFFRISDPDDHILFSVECHPPEEKANTKTTPVADNHRWWLELIPVFSRQIAECLQAEWFRISSLSTVTPDIWSYWDFFYFSTIVQTTVGFGDILPNSTTVRKIVSLQVLLGYALLIVVLNVVMN